MDIKRKEIFLFSNKILITLGVLTIIFFLGLYFPFYILPFSVNVGFTQPSLPKAAIVDQGSLAPTAGPNPVFVKKATAILKEAGFSVDYYPGEEVTVEFYRNLPTYGYDFIIRACSILKCYSNTISYKGRQQKLTQKKCSYMGFGG